jgi:hypothetical protein
MAYDRGLPIMVLRAENIKPEGFLEATYDWKVQAVDFDTDFLDGKNFDAMLEEFSRQVDDFKEGKYNRFAVTMQRSKSKQTIGDIASNLSVESFIQIITLMAALISTAFFAGMYFPQ